MIAFFCFDIVNLMKLPELGNERKVKVSQDYGKAGFGINMKAFSTFYGIKRM